MTDLMWLDLKQAARRVMRSSRASAAFVAVVALGLWFALVMFAVADPLLFRPLPYAHAADLISVRVQLTRVVRAISGAPTFADWAARRDLFEDLTGYGETESVRVRLPSGTALLRVVPVASNFFSMLDPASVGISTPSGDDRVIVLNPTTGARLGLPPAVAAPVSRADGAPVLLSPRRTLFVFPAASLERRPDAIRVSRLGPVVWGGSSSVSSLTLLARPATGQRPEVIAAALTATLPPGMKVLIEPLNDQLRTLPAKQAWPVLGFGLAIMIACAANAANIVMVMMSYRAAEYATRRALGASAAALLRMLATELTVMLVTALAVATVLARVTLAAIVAFMPSQLLSLGVPHIGPREVLVAVGLCAVFGGVAASLGWTTWRWSAGVMGLKGQLSAGVRTRAARMAMIALQAGAATVLLVAGVLLAQSYARLWAQDIGFDPDSQVVSVSPSATLGAAETTRRVLETVRRMERVPGVTVAGAMSGFLLDNGASAGGTPVRVAGRTVLLQPKAVTPGYLEAAGAHLVAGRLLTVDDAPWVSLVLAEAFARRLWPSREPRAAVGEPLSRPGGELGHVVGIVSDMKDRALDRGGSSLAFHRLDSVEADLPVQYALHLASSASGLPSAVTQAIQDVDPDASVTQTGTFEERLSGTVRARTFAAAASTLFAAAGTLVCLLGVWAVVSFVVARRSREVAIRLALGAPPRAIVRVVTKETLVAALIGIGGGVAVAKAVGTFLGSQLFGVQPGDSLTTFVVACTLTVLALGASWLPARRATAISPSSALRVD